MTEPIEVTDIYGVKLASGRGRRLVGKTDGDKLVLLEQLPKQEPRLIVDPFTWAQMIDFAHQIIAGEQAAHTHPKGPLAMATFVLAQAAEA